MKVSRFWLLPLACVALAIHGQAAPVRVWKGTIDLPTYLLGQEDPNPPLFQVATAGELILIHRVYPYTMLDDLTDRVETKTYTAVYIENEFLKAIVLPELGGRLYSLYDKVNGREVFYRNHVVKYALISLRGAWISGGIEFNFPDGHTVATVSPVAYTLREEPDGSATVVVGKMDWTTGMHWEIALTLRPGQARLEQRVALFNPTPTPHVYWFWANAAVPASEDMQFIYPMREAFTDVRGVAWSYPLHNGVDYSWPKNIREATSLFARQVERSFFGAYYHQSDRGVIHVASFRDVPGKKIWTWGEADDGLIWTDLLTDHDGPYYEIQSGRYETQLSYEFMPPRHQESWTEYWYPVEGLHGGFVEGTRDFALNVNYLKASANRGPRVEFMVFPTVRLERAKVRIRLAAKSLGEFNTQNFQPMTTVPFEVAVADLEAAKKGVTFDLESSDGHPLLHWSAADPIDGNPDFSPAANARAPAHPSPDKMTTEELFLSGEEQERYGQEQAGQEIFQHLLQRDPGFVPALVKRAWYLYEAGDLSGADSFIGRALAQTSTDSAVNYAAGVIYRAEQRFSLAQDAFWEVIHLGAPPALALGQLGEISIRLKKFDEAADLLGRSLRYNPDDTLTRVDLAVALRLAGQPNAAAQTIAETSRAMPILPFVLAEEWRLQEGQGGRTSQPPTAQPGWASALPSDSQDYLEVAAWYRRLGDLKSAKAVLHNALHSLPAESISPLIYYYLAFDSRAENQEDDARRFAQQAKSASPDKVFPNRLEDVLVLQDALAQEPRDSHAQYFLGNFLFAHGRYEQAAQLWLQAVQEGFDFSVLYRNLGLYSWRTKKDLKGAAEFYERAIHSAPNDYRLYVDLDEIYAQQGDAGQRENLFARAPTAVLNRDAVLLRRALLRMEQQRYDQALDLLDRHRFKPREGEVVFHQVYEFANIEKGREALAVKRPAQAEAAFREALDYPRNLGIGRPDKPQDGEAQYWLGEALAEQGKKEAARQAWRAAALDAQGGGSIASLFRALALSRLGEDENGERLLQPWRDLGTQDKLTAEDFYAAGMLAAIEQRTDTARTDFRHALGLDPSLWQARVRLAQISQ